MSGKCDNCGEHCLDCKCKRYSVICIRCRKKLSKKRTEFTSHCVKCYPLVKEKWEEIYKEIEKLRMQGENFAYGFDVILKNYNAKALKKVDQ